MSRSLDLSLNRSRWPGGSPNVPPGQAMTIVASFGAGVLHEGVEPLEDLLIDAEDHAEYEQRENRRDGHPHQPVPALPLPGGDPPLDWRQPEHEQEQAARHVLVEALGEDGVTVTGVARAVVRVPVLEPESFQQGQVEEQQPPDDIGEPLQLLPVPAELALR